MRTFTLGAQYRSCNKPKDFEHKTKYTVVGIMVFFVLHPYPKGAF